MLIEKLDNKGQSLELHHLGRLKLRMQICNPNPKGFIKDVWEQPMIGTCYTDGYLYQDIEHDFYYTYERREGKRIKEIVSFTRPVTLLGNKSRDTGRKALLMQLIPSQHPAVTRYDFDFEPSGFNISAGSENFYGWQFFKTTLKRGVKREVRNESYGFLIENGLERDVKTFIPGQIFEPLYKSAPLYVLDVLDLVEFDLLGPIPQDITNILNQDSQKLLVD